MPGQRKRKRRQQEGRQRAAARFAPEIATETGRWEVLFETQDESEWRVELQRLRTENSENKQIDWTAVRLDTLCGRLTQPTTYRLSLFVPTSVPVAADGGSDN
ncbi:hypothetical protein [Streptomyces sp. NBC_00872]|uniref:hypothetical protein n=1 Tax=Streptomyces sp. NBC_00872 TaxID=2903686 RepID=UPI003864D8C4|nr:hypothetical protein OG214_00400 [Streptomyces sp. NBC_00872]